LIHFYKSPRYLTVHMYSALLALCCDQLPCDSSDARWAASWNFSDLAWQMRQNMATAHGGDSLPGKLSASKCDWE